MRDSCSTVLTVAAPSLTSRKHAVCSITDGLSIANTGDHELCPESYRLRRWFGRRRIDTQYRITATSIATHSSPSFVCTARAIMSVSEHRCANNDRRPQQNPPPTPGFKKRGPQGSQNKPPLPRPRPILAFLGLYHALCSANSKAPVDHRQSVLYCTCCGGIPARIGRKTKRLSATPLRDGRRRSGACKRQHMRTPSPARRHIIAIERHREGVGPQANTAQAISKPPTT